MEDIFQLEMAVSNFNDHTLLAQNFPQNYVDSWIVCGQTQLQDRYKRSVSS